MLVLLFLAPVLLCAHGVGLREEFTWSRISYVWPSESRFGRYRQPSGQVANSGGDIAFPGSVSTAQKRPTTSTTVAPSSQDQDDFYIYQNNVPMGANRWNDKLFITVPRRRRGVPSTLNYVSLNSTDRHNVPLTPYPNWDLNQIDLNPENRIVSVYRIAVDACDRLWMVDTGIIETLGNRTDLQPHSIKIIDLKTDKLIKNYQIPAGNLRAATVLAYMVVDVSADACDKAYAYMPDLAGYGLVVYSLEADDSWRVNHNYFFLEPSAGEFRIGGQAFQWNDGIFSIALSDVASDGYRKAYFHSMAGTHLYQVSTKILQDKQLASRSYHEDDFKILGDRGPLSQTSASDLHKPSGVLFLNLVNQNALGCWNTNGKFDKADFDVVQKDDAKMIYPCDLKVYRDEVILLTNNMPIFLYSKLNYDETNFRVWMNDVNAAVSGTKCAAPKPSTTRPSYSRT